MQKFTVLLSSLLAIALMGCGDDDTLTPEEANQAFTSTNLAVASASIAAAEAAVSGSGGQITAEAMCLEGGSTAITGTFDNADDFALDITFSSCKAANITMDGSLNYATTISDTNVTLTMSGMLTYSGAVSGTCSVDVTASVGVGNTSTSGTICGQEINVSIMVP